VSTLNKEKCKRKKAILYTAGNQFVPYDCVCVEACMCKTSVKGTLCPVQASVFKDNCMVF